jgi:hypothetical protein
VADYSGALIALAVMELGRCPDCPAVAQWDAAGELVVVHHAAGCPAPRWLGNPRGRLLLGDGRELAYQNTYGEG